MSERLTRFFAKISFPFMLRRTAQASMQVLEERLACRNKEHADRVAKLERADRQEVEQLLRPMVEKFLRMQVRRDAEFGRWCFTIEMDASFVEECLRHGDSDTEIDYLGEMIGRMAHQKAVEVLRHRNCYRTANRR